MIYSNGTEPQLKMFIKKNLTAAGTKELLSRSGEHRGITSHSLKSIKTLCRGLISNIKAIFSLVSHGQSRSQPFLNSVFVCFCFLCRCELHPTPVCLCVCVVVRHDTNTDAVTQTQREACLKMGWLLIFIWIQWECLIFWKSASVNTWWWDVLSRPSQ